MFKIKMISSIGAVALAMSAGFAQAQSYGGVPIVVGGKIVGAVGVSGVTGDQDEQCAMAGVSAL